MPESNRPGRGKVAVAAAAAVTLGAAVVGLFGASSAEAAASGTTITVNTLAFSASSSTSTCADSESTPQCSLEAALAYANALPANTGPITINFASGLNGLITDSTPGAGQMATYAPGSDYQDGGYTGADFVVNAAAGNAVTIDFGGDVGFQTTYDSGYNGFDIKSNNTTITNFTNINAGEAAFLVDGATGTTISNGASNQIQSGGNNTNWLESGVVLMTGSANTAISNYTVYDPCLDAVAVNSNATVTNTTLTNVSMTNKADAPYFAWFGPSSTTTGTTMTNVSDAVPTGAPVPAYGVLIDASSTVNNLTITKSTFSGMTNAILEAAATEPTNNLTITNNTFNGVGEAFEDGYGAQQNVTITGNTFENGTASGSYWAGQLHLDTGVYTNANISNNTFTNNTAVGDSEIAFTQAGGSGNVINNNTFTRTNKTYSNEDAIWSYVNTGSAAKPTGWSITNNSIDGYAGVTYSPIGFYGAGIEPTTGNTFGPNTNGTTSNTAAEGGLDFFVTNAGGGANNNIQTWRPSNPVFNGSTVTFNVAPVNPVVGGDALNQPTTPVSLGVYWTASDNAEVYLGQINNVSSAGTVSIPSTETGGFIRVQTIQADGTSSQYSGIAQVSTNIAPPVITGPTGGSSGSGGTMINGTGIPGATVTVTDSTTGNTVCTATVDANGNWSCLPNVVLTAGTHTLVATQTASGVVSGQSNSVTFTSDGTPMFASAWVAGLMLLLLGGIAAVVVRRRRLTVPQ